jgi:enterochelin esterase-like enzyme
MPLLLALLLAVPAAGKVQPATVHSDTYAAERRVWVYTPPGYDPARGPYDLLLCFDGEEYLEAIRPIGGAAPDFLEVHRRLRDLLQAKGYQVFYTEVQGGKHHPDSWKERLPADPATLVAGWPKAAAGPR